MGSQKRKPARELLEARRAAALLTSGMTTSERRRFLESDAGQDQIRRALAAAQALMQSRTPAPAFGGTLMGGGPAFTRQSMGPDPLERACADVRAADAAAAQERARLHKAVDRLTAAACPADAARLRAMLAARPEHAARVCRRVAEMEAALAENRARLRLSSLRSICSRFPQVREFMTHMTLQLPLPASLAGFTRAHWKLSDPSGRTLAHALAAEGILPKTFNQWKLTDGAGMTVRDVFEQRGSWAVHQGKAPDTRTMIHMALREIMAHS